MQSQLEAIFDEAETRYLKPEELTVLSQFVDSLPERVEAYRTIRDQEIQLLQQVADRLEAEFPQEKTEVLERSLKHGILTLRYCALGMLLNDESLVQKRLIDWLNQMVEVYNTRAIDTALYRLLEQGLNQTLSQKQLALLKPFLSLTANALAGSQAKQAEPLTAANLF